MKQLKNNSINLDLAPRVSPSPFENNGKLSILARIFGVGHIVALPHKASFDSQLKREFQISRLNNHQTAIVRDSGGRFRYEMQLADDVLSRPSV